MERWSSQVRRDSSPAFIASFLAFKKALASFLMVSVARSTRGIRPACEVFFYLSYLSAAAFQPSSHEPK
jgi:hypothetical protein